jgi:hypothetical protein
MSERKKVASKEVTESGVEITFSNEETLSVGLSDLSEEIVKQLALHGLSQKLGDSYAGSKGDAGEAVKMARAVADRLKSGEWTAKRESSGGTGRVTDLARALAEVAGKEIVEAVAVLDGMEKGEKLALRKHARIAAVLARMAMEKAQAAADAAEGSEELPL